jgi:AmmeMemoRadiSam system protein B
MRKNNGGKSGSGEIMYIRKPVVSGHFYPAGKDELERMLRFMIGAPGEKAKARAVVVPHAGYAYSGAVAGKVFGVVEIPGSVIILGPNHTGYGEPFAVETSGAWETPLGMVQIDSGLARLLLQHSGYLQEDRLAARGEHSIEVQIPFLQYLRPDVTIVPVVLSGLVSSPAWAETGKAIAAAVKASGKDALIVASSDFTHYEPKKDAERKDRFVVEAIEVLDPALAVERIEQEEVSMCGYGPVLVAMAAAKEMGARRGVLLEYRTSGDVSKEYDSVVGYAGIAIS